MLNNLPKRASPTSVFQDVGPAHFWGYSDVKPLLLKVEVLPVPHDSIVPRGCVKIGEASPYTGLCGCSMEQPYRDNVLIIKSVGMLPGASAEYISLSMNIKHLKNRLHQFLIQPLTFNNSMMFYYIS